MKYDFSFRYDFGQVTHGVIAVAETARARKALKDHPGGRYYDQDWTFTVASNDLRVSGFGPRENAESILHSEFPKMTVDPIDGLECWYWK